MCVYVHVCAPFCFWREGADNTREERKKDKNKQACQKTAKEIIIAHVEVDGPKEEHITIPTPMDRTTTRIRTAAPIMDDPMEQGPTLRLPTIHDQNKRGHFQSIRFHKRNTYLEKIVSNSNKPYILRELPDWQGPP